MRLPGVEWDEPKARSNITNHHLSFDVAQYALFDPGRLERADASESNVTAENRWQVLGKVGKIILAVYEDKGQVKRLISAWFAEKQERRIYHGYYEEVYENWYHDGYQEY